MKSDGGSVAENKTHPPHQLPTLIFFALLTRPAKINHWREKSQNMQKREFYRLNDVITLQKAWWLPIFFAHFHTLPKGKWGPQLKKNLTGGKENSYFCVAFLATVRWYSEGATKTRPVGAKLDWGRPPSLKSELPPRRRGRVVGWICAIRTIGARQRANGLSSMGKIFALLWHFVGYKTCDTFVFYWQHSQKLDQIKEKIRKTSKVPNISLFTITMGHNAVK